MTCKALQAAKAQDRARRTAIPAGRFGSPPDRAAIIAAAPPTLGQHNDEILGALGLSADELACLRAERVIGERVLNA